jgi:hypothetical protein
LIEYDLLLKSLENIINEAIYVEDNEIFLKRNCGYNLYNLLCVVDKKFIEKLHKELEYKDVQ